MFHLQKTNEDSTLFLCPDANTDTLLLFFCSLFTHWVESVPKAWAMGMVVLSYLGNLKESLTSKVIKKH